MLECFYRASSVNDGFPLKICGNDRRSEGMTCGGYFSCALYRNLLTFVNILRLRKLRSGYFCLLYWWYVILNAVLSLVGQIPIPFRWRDGATGKNPYHRCTPPHNHDPNITVSGIPRLSDVRKLWEAWTGSALQAHKYSGWMDDSGVNNDTCLVFFFNEQCGIKFLQTWSCHSERSEESL